MDRTIENLLEDLRKTAAHLESLDASDESWLADATADGRPQDRARIDELVHAATHELGSQLGFIVRDLETVVNRLAVRRRYADSLTDDQFDLVISSAWSIDLVRQIATARGLHSADEQHRLSQLLRAVQGEWK